MAGITLYRAEDFRGKLSEALGGDLSKFKGADDSVIPEVGLIKDYVGVKAVDQESRTADFIISDGEVDRDRDVIAVGGWDLKSFKKNPVVLWAHNSSQPPIGVATRIRRDGSQLVSTAKFSEENPMGDLVFRMINEKMLRASSVGFRPLKFNFVGDTEDEERRGGIDFLKQELLEWSIVPIPANPRAIIQLHGLGVDTRPLKEWAEQVLDLHEEIKGLGVNDLEEAWKIVSRSGTVFDMKLGDKDSNLEIDIDPDPEPEETPKAVEDQETKDRMKVLAEVVAKAGGIDAAIAKLMVDPAMLTVTIKDVREPTVVEALGIVHDFYEQCGDEVVCGKIQADVRMFEAAGVTPALHKGDDPPDDEEKDEGDDFYALFGEVDGDKVTVSPELADAVNGKAGGDDDEVLIVDQEFYDMVVGSKGNTRGEDDNSSDKEA